MRLQELPIPGVLLVTSEVNADDRGSFRRIADLPALGALGLDVQIVQVSSAQNLERGTVRGLHYQAPPHEESKTLWCTCGRVYDVLVDLRRDSRTYGRWTAVELSARVPVALHVPRGIAHGYQTLDDDSELTYLISTPFVAESARSISWQDPTLAIDWPLPVTRISERDRQAPTWPIEY